MRRFFVSGYNKSGTTFLQMLLDSHPSINCPSEHYINAMVQFITQFAKQYRRQLELFDSRTAKQGIRFNERQFVTKVLRSMLLTAMDFGVADHTTHSGLNDNSLFNNVELFVEILPEALFVFIVRDPREVGVSLWHHKMRTEPEFAARKVSLEAIVASLAETWPAHVRKLQAFSEAHPEIAHVVRYEDLVSTDRDRYLCKVLEFLNVSYDAATIEKMWTANDFLRLQRDEVSKNPQQAAGFFRSGKTNSWRDELSADGNSVFVAKAKLELDRFGYPTG